MSCSGFTSRIWCVGLLMGVLSAAAWSVEAPSAAGTQIALPKVERMPNLPEPYALRDWKKVARDLDGFVFNLGAKGEHLPVCWLDTSHVNTDQDTFGVKAYVGDPRQTGKTYDIITCLEAVLAGSMVGIDKSNQNGRNWVAMCQGYFGKANGENVYLNNIGGSTGQTFWYELLPNMLFYQINARYPGVGEMDQQFVTVADRWREACVAMGGSTSPWTLPEFDHTAFSFSTMKPVDNGVWKEADACAAIAWIEYMAYVKTGDTKYLEAARWGLEYMDRCQKNPYYECLLPYGVLAAARANAELGHEHNVQKFINWVFDGDNWRKWGISEGRWGDYDISGLGSSVVPDFGYAFAMNTYMAAALMTPVARYDQRYARAIGKWMLNVANASRFFYGDGLPKEHQTCYEWIEKNDPNHCLAYEGLRQHATTNAVATEDVSTAKGALRSGSFQDTVYQDKKYEVLAETADGEHDALEHVWKLPLQKALRHVIVIWAHCAKGGDADEGFKFSYATTPEGPYKEMFRIATTEDTHGWMEIKGNPPVIYVKVEDTNRDRGNAKPDTLFVDGIAVETKLDKSPYAMGDPLMLGWAKTDLGLYGSVCVGMLGAIVAPTDVDRVLQLDLLATDSFVPKAYPTHLYYNPFKEAKQVTVDVGAASTDLYEATSGQFIKKSVTGAVPVTVPADSAIVLVRCPANGQVTYEKNKTLVNGRVIDYRNGR